MKAFHGFFAVQKGQDIFGITGIVPRSFEKRGVEHDVIVFPGLSAGLVDGMHSAGEDHHQIPGAEPVSLPPYRDQNLPPDTVNQLKIVMPVQGEGRDEFGDNAVVDGIRKGGGSVGFGFMYGHALHIVHILLGFDSGC